MTNIKEGESHTEWHKGCHVVYWKDNVAASRSYANWAEINTWSAGAGYSTLRKFTLPDDLYLLDRYVVSFRRAFDEGRRDKASEIRKALTE